VHATANQPPEHFESKTKTKITSSSAMAERPCELGDFKKARVNSGTDNHSLKGFSQVSPLLLTDPHHMVIK